MKEKIYVGHTLQEVEELAVKELGVAKEDLYFDVLTPEEVSRDEIQVHVMVDANPIKKAKDYLEIFLQNANIMGYVERKMRDNVVEYSVSTDGANNVLIGKGAKTLSAFQFLASMIVNQYFDRDHESGFVVKVDVGDYRKKRDEQLERMATRIARDVAKTKIPVKLHYMNAYERKVVHNKLSDWRDVTTHSEGVEPERYLIIEPRVKK
ncbi:MAG TPA: R3H domain-containing nucleic acid-binding protein [Bacilli bacterium]|nr:R3H domain-containing nucleic acid-binding protein [Bacilli bacterium]HPK58523.1 R3H domain-containing nucleic acid-binding protein [Bacilli bacterium]